MRVLVLFAVLLAATALLPADALAAGYLDLPVRAGSGGIVFKQAGWLPSFSATHIWGAAALAASGVAMAWFQGHGRA